MSHPRCPRCKALLIYLPENIDGPARVKCLPCGWEKLKPEIEDRRQTTDLKTDSCLLNSEYLPKEKPMRRATHGHCPSCGRDDVNMPGPICSRCYDRKKRGVAVDAPGRYQEKPVGAIPAGRPDAIGKNVAYRSEGEPAASPLPVPSLQSYDLGASCVRPPAFHRTSQILTTYTLFAHESDLVKELLVRAKKSRRTLEGEILFRLEQTLEVF